MSDVSAFPPEFVWGVATSAYQIEGAAETDGRGLSIWDSFSRRPGTTADGQSGDIACDHYHRWAEDLDLIRSLGVNAYRFSFSWSRVQPNGRGATNPKGLDFYERLVDGMLERGLRPYATLFHWDLPEALQARGGWANRDTACYFADYAELMARRFGDRLASIATLNEPWCSATLGHETGEFAPGLRDRRIAVQVSHHLLLAHGLAIKAMRVVAPRTALGIVLNLQPHHPARDSEADRQLARRLDGQLVRWYMDPLFGGRYPQDILDELGADGPRVGLDDLRLIREPIDFLGINYYTRGWCHADDPAARPDSPYAFTDMGWEVYPQGLTELLLRLARDYRLPPLYITENGAAFPDRLEGDAVHDPERVRYYQLHLAALADALRQGVDVRGYFAWSLMDNFEWSRGYAKRFGLVHVDYATQRRTPKDSAHWYREWIATCRTATAPVTA